VPLPPGDGAISGVANDGRLVFSDAQGRFIPILVDPRTGRRQTLQAGPPDPGCFASSFSFTPGDTLVGYADGCNHLVAWDVGSRRLARAAAMPESLGGGFRSRPTAGTCSAI
jgi:hypothetical protein